MSDTQQFRAAFPSGPVTNPPNDEVSAPWRGFFMALYSRTGGANGSSTAAVGVGLAAETAARIAADNTLTTNLAAETARAEAAEAGLLPKAGGVLSGPISGGTATFATYVTPAGPTWTAGAGVPTGRVAPVGSLFSRTDGAVGSTIYISRGGGTWIAIPGV